MMALMEHWLLAAYVAGMFDKYHRNEACQINEASTIGRSE